MVGGIVDFGGDLAGTNCFMRRENECEASGVNVKGGEPLGGGGGFGLLGDGVAIGGERLVRDGGFGLLGDGVGVGGGAPWGSGLGPPWVWQWRGRWWWRRIHSC